MTGVDPAMGYVWLLTVLLAVGTFSLRLSFLQFESVVAELPSGVERGLGFVPAAILTALVFPELFAFGAGVGGFVNARSIAGAVAAVVAWRTRNILATMVVGMAVLWALGWLVG